MNEFDKVFEKALKGFEYKSKEHQWSRIKNSVSKEKQTEAKAYFDKIYYPQKLAGYHSPERLFAFYWKGDIEKEGLGIYDMEMKTKLSKAGFDGKVEKNVMSIRKQKLDERFKLYKGMITNLLKNLNEDEKMVAGIVYGEVSRVNDTMPTKEMLATASLIKDRMDFVNEQPKGSKQQKQAIKDYGDGTYKGIISHSGQFGSYQEAYYNNMIENKFPDNFKALKTAIGSIAAVVQVIKNGEIPKELKGVMFMRTVGYPLKFDSMSPINPNPTTIGGNIFYFRKN